MIRQLTVVVDLPAANDYHATKLADQVLGFARACGEVVRVEEQDRPTPEEIDALLESDGVDIRTKAGSWRCVTSVQLGEDGETWYGTIRAERNSAAGRHTLVRAADVVEARGWRAGS